PRKHDARLVEPARREAFELCPGREPEHQQRPRAIGADRRGEREWRGLDGELEALELAQIVASASALAGAKPGRDRAAVRDARTHGAEPVGLAPLHPPRAV